MMKGKIRRGVSLFVLTVLAVTNVVGCGKKEAKEESLAAKAVATSKDYVFKCEDLNIEGADPKSVSSLSIVGDRVYLVLNDFENAKSSYISFNPDGSDPKVTNIEANKAEYIYDLEFNKDGSCYAISTSKSDSASDEASDDESEEGTEGMGQYETDNSNFNCELVKLDTEGHVTERQPLKKDGEDYAIYQITGYDDDKVLISSSRGIEMYSEADGLKTVFDAKKDKSPFDDEYCNLYTNPDNKIFVKGSVNHTDVAYLFDPIKGEFTQQCTGLDIGDAFDGFSILTGKGHDLYASDQNSLYGYDVAKGETVKIMDYIDSGITCNSSIFCLTALSDSDFIVFVPGPNLTGSICRFTKVPADQVRDKKIVTFGGPFIDETFRTQVVQFNASHEDCNIKLVDYAEYNTEDDYEAGSEKFDLDVIAGTAPDVMIFNPEEATDKYADKGVFMDLKPFLDKDEELKNAILPNLLESMKTGDKIYSIYPKFTVETFITKSKNTGGKDTITFDEVEKLRNDNNIDYGFLYGAADETSMLNQGILYTGDKYIDWENKKCNFDSDEFISILEFAKKFKGCGSSISAEDDYISLFHDDKSLFYNSGLDSIKTYRELKQVVFGEDIKLIGYPNDEGINQSSIKPTASLTINSHAQYPDAAWEFVRSFLLEEYQNNNDLRGIPVTEKGIDFVLEKAMSKTSDQNEERDNMSYYSDPPTKLEPLTQEDADYIKNFIKSLNRMYYYNVYVFNIIKEEASAYFSGQKTAKEAADIIQSRLTIYVNEVS